MDGFDATSRQATCATNLRGGYSSATVTRRAAAALVVIESTGLSAQGRVVRAYFGSNGELYYVDGFPFEGPAIVP